MPDFLSLPLLLSLPEQKPPDIERRILGPWYNTHGAENQASNGAIQNVDAILFLVIVAGPLWRR
jgi:hypothetical protein